MYTISFIVVTVSTFACPYCSLAETQQSIHFLAIRTPSLIQYQIFHSKGIMLVFLSLSLSENFELYYCGYEHARIKFQPVTLRFACTSSVNIEMDRYFCLLLGKFIEQIVLCRNLLEMLMWPFQNDCAKHVLELWSSRKLIIYFSIAANRHLIIRVCHYVA